MNLLKQISTLTNIPLSQILQFCLHIGCRSCHGLLTLLYKWQILANNQIITFQQHVCTSWVAHSIILSFVRINQIKPIIISANQIPNHYKI